MNIKNFKQFSVNEELSSDQAAEELQKALHSSTPAEFMEKFKNIADDTKVQAVLKAGRTDGHKHDESIEYHETNLKVADLFPTQAEIGFDQSINTIISDEHGSLKSILEGHPHVGGPIVTYNGKYIIDGHHRWSQVFAANPKSDIACLNMVGNLSPQAMLVAVQTAVVASSGELPSSNPKGENIFAKLEKEKILEKVKSNLTDKARKVWSEFGFDGEEAIATNIYNNLEILINDHKPIKDAPGRKDMPQTNAKGEVEDKLELLKKGKVNFKDPKASDLKVQAESKILRFDDYILEKEEKEDLYVLDLIMRYVKDPEEAEKYAYDTPQSAWPDWLVANLERDPDWKKLTGE